MPRRPQEEKQKIQNDLRILTERLSRINDSLARKVASRNEYDKTIMETEAAYMKILESSQVPHPSPITPHCSSRDCHLFAFLLYACVCLENFRSPPGGAFGGVLCPLRAQTLLHVLKRESVNLTKKQSASSGQ